MSPRLDQARPFLVLGIVLATWLVLPTAVKRLARLTFFEFQAPVDVAAARVRDLQDYWSLRTRPKNDLIEAGKELARLNSYYENKINETASLRDEVRRLGELLRMPALNDYRAEPARVVRRDYNAWWQRIVIRKGRDYGITVGSPVIFVGGVVGRVSEVGAYTSVVDLISSPGVRLSAIIESDPARRPVNYQGRSSPAFGNATGTIEFVPLDVFMMPGNVTRVVTSGLGGVFPPSLAIGRVSKIETGADGLFKTGEVQLDPRLASITEVTVLVPLGNEKAEMGAISPGTSRNNAQ
jgi:rod shape-determining protein MreC